MACVRDLTPSYPAAGIHDNTKDMDRTLLWLWVNLLQAHWIVGFWRGNLEERWQLLHQTLALTNRLESVASGWRLKARSCFRHALFRSLSLIQPSESCSAVAARGIWDIYLSWGPLDWLTAGLAVYCHIISHCLRLFNGGPSTCDREAFCERR